MQIYTADIKEKYQPIIHELITECDHDDPRKNASILIDVFTDGSSKIVSKEFRRSIGAGLVDSFVIILEKPIEEKEPTATRILIYHGDRQMSMEDIRFVLSRNITSCVEVGSL